MPRIRYASLLDRLASNLALTDDGCLIWDGLVSRDGYSRIRTGSRSDGTRRSRLLHRVVWEELIGPIPDGLVLDHLCRNRACALPDHLEVVTQLTNMQRSDHATRTHCPRGHEYDAENTYRYRGGRFCRKCNVIAVRRYRERRAAA